MYKVIASLVAAIAVASGLSAMAEENHITFQSQIKDSDSRAFYVAMCGLENEESDIVYKLTYDVFADGRKKMSLLMKERLSRYQKEINTICATFDSIVSRPDVHRAAYRNQENAKSTRAYKKYAKTKPNMIDLTGNGRDLIDMETITHDLIDAVAITIDGDYFNVAQQIEQSSGKKAGAADLSDLHAKFKELKSNNPGIQISATQCMSSRNSGALRLPESKQESKNQLTGVSFRISDASPELWSEVCDAFMKYYGADEVLSLTYYRSSRTVTLLDPIHKTIYAAKFVPKVYNAKVRGQLCIYEGEYTIEPFLPENWARLSVNDVGVPSEGSGEVKSISISIVE